MRVFIILITIVGMLIAGGSDTCTEEHGHFHKYTLSNKDAKFNPASIVEALKAKGFTIGENANIKAELHHLYQENDFKIYNNISFFHKEKTLKILEKYPNVGVLIPMGMVVYQGLNEEDLHIVLTTAEMQSEVTGVSLEELQGLESEVLQTIKGLVPTAEHSHSLKCEPEKEELLTKYSLELKGADFDDVREELEENFEDTFFKAGFAMPSYFDFTDDLAENSMYDFYVTYAICKIDVLRLVIKVKPSVAVLGPCTTMIYKKKGEDKIVMGFASIYNWISSTHMKDKVAVKRLLDLQKEYEGILKDVTDN